MCLSACGANDTSWPRWRISAGYLYVTTRNIANAALDKQLLGVDELNTDKLHELMAQPADSVETKELATILERAIDARRAYARARRRFWRSFAFEVLAVGALLAALWLLSSTSLLAPLAGPTHWGLAPPLLLILLLWFGTQRWRQA